jgi:hypothetical protein
VLGCGGAGGGDGVWLPFLVEIEKQLWTVDR